MSAHDEFRRRRLIFMGGIFVGFILFGLGGSLSNSTHSPIPIVVLFVGFGLAFVSVAFMQFGFRCPRCRKLMLAMNTPGTSFFSFPNFCANCGVDLNAVDKNNEPI